MGKSYPRGKGRARRLAGLLAGSWLLVAPRAWAQTGYPEPRFTFDILHAFETQQNPAGGLIQGLDGALYGTTHVGGRGGWGTVFKINPDGSGYVVLHDFEWYDGAEPYGRLLQASDGALYGTASRGGTKGFGVVFKLEADGSGFAELHEFVGAGADGANPFAGLIQATDGALYGTTWQGGVFRINPDGSGFDTLTRFISEPWGYLYAPLIQGTDGALYGASELGGAPGALGFLFKVNPDGSGYSRLHDFEGADGERPYGGLYEAADGWLYGTTYVGGPSHQGVVFKIRNDGSSFAKLHDFTAAEGAGPYSSLVADVDGTLVGTTIGGGANGQGVIFRISTDGSSFVKLHDLLPSEGAQPYGGVVRGVDGAFYGTTQFGAAHGQGSVFQVAADGSSFTSLYEFEGAASGKPYGGLIEASDGDLYGTGSVGGANGKGLIFKIGKDGSGFAEIYSFDGANGAAPHAGVLQGTDGAFYGTTMSGGSADKGVIFKVDVDGSNFVKLHDFDADGATPMADLIQGLDGVLYGVTSRGGAADAGTVFRINPDGSMYARIHDFTGYDGALPKGRLIQTADGMLYGTASSGWNAGAIFKLQPDGSGFANVHIFHGTDGEYPEGGLLEGPDGALYGTLGGGAIEPHRGFVFRINKDGSGLTNLHQFGAYDSGVSQGALVLGPDGALYGTSWFYPTVFRMSLDGSKFTRYVFGSNEGAEVTAGLLVGTDGALYGTTYAGGPQNGGVVFRVVSAGPPVPSVSNVSAGEGDTGTAALTFTVSLAAPASRVIKIPYKTVEGTASAENDYFPAEGVLIFQPGDTTRTVIVEIKSDTLYEADEDFSLILENGPQAQGTIVNDDPLPTLTINAPIVVAEGNAGTQTLRFSVVQSTVTGAMTTFRYATEDITATAEEDYLPISGLARIPPGSLISTMDVVVKGDEVIEPDESFRIKLSNPTNAILTTDESQGIIRNDDLPGTMAFSAASYLTSEASGKVAITVVRRGSTTTRVEVDYGTLEATAAAPRDYASTAGTLTFDPRVTSRTFTVPIVRDSSSRGDRTFLLHLTNPQPLSLGAALDAPSTAVVTIRDDDRAGTIAFAAPTYTVEEGAGSVLLKVKRSGGAASGVGVHYDTTSATATGAGTDYTDASGYLAFASSGAEATLRSIVVPITPDLVAEGAETFTVTLSNPDGGASLGAPSVATVMIRDSQATVEFRASSVSAKEGATAVVSVERSGPANGPASVRYATSDGTATSSLDYKPVSGTLTFASGVKARTLSIPLLRDSLVEGPETVNLTLSDGVGVVLGPRAVAALTIQDADVAPVLQWSAPGFVANEALSPAVAKARRTGNLADTVTVDFAVSGGTATGTPGPSQDFLLTPGTLTFGRGVSLQTVPIGLVKDGQIEGTETVSLVLSSPQNLDEPGQVALGPLSTALLSIMDQGPTVQFGAAAYAVKEASRRLSVTVRRMGSTTGSASVAYAATGGTATRDTGSGGDFSLAPGTLEFGAGQGAKTFSIALEPDTVAEGPETIVLTLSNPSGAGLGTPSTAVVTIGDDDKAGEVGFDALSYSAGAQAGTATVTLRRTGRSSAARVHWATTAGGTALPGVNYTPATGSIEFGLNEVVRTFTVAVLEDGVHDGSATSVQLALDSPDGGLVLALRSQATLWIVKD